MMKLKAISVLLSAFLIGLPSAAFASMPENWKINLQEAASPMAEHIHEFHNILLWIIIATVIFVMVLLVWVIIRYNHKANPVPAQFTHHVMLEVLWTLVPIIILVFIAVPSFRILYYNDSTKTPEMTLKIIGYQWYWNYEYPDHGDIAFDSYMVADDEIKGDQQRLLSTDTQIVLPVDTDIQLLISAGDVIHSWTIPAFGVKLDGVPGRWNETWVRINKPGIYYGQCSELCGKDHSYMPIEVKAVSKEDFKKWALSNGAAEADFETAAIQAPKETQE